MITKSKDTVYIATLSGGKDSVTMCDLLLKNGYPVDYIVFNDTTNEYKLMYEYLEKVKSYFSNRYKKEIITTKPIRDFKSSILKKVTRSKNLSKNGNFVGIPVADKGDTMCHLRRTLKINPTDKWIKKNIKGNIKIYVGYTTDEKSRVKKNSTNEIYPLIEYFNMSENDCKKYLVEQEMENPLYRFFNRTGCKLCPYKSRRSWVNTFRHFREDWEYAKSIEDELILNQKEYCYFIGNKPLKKYELEFSQGSLFDFSDEPLKDCFCKI